MPCCLSDLSDKEIVNVCDGTRLGYVGDAEVDICTGKITALIASGDCSGLFSKPDEIRVPWECVKNIGDDIVIVEMKDMCRSDGGDCGEGRRKKKGWI